MRVIPSLFYDDYGLSDSPYLNHFLQPDTIIPSLSDPQSWNHYSYVLNNPIRNNDPSGHCSGDPNNSQNPDAGCWEMINQITSNYDFISIDSANWTEKELRHVNTALGAMATTFGGTDQLSKVMGNVSLYRRGQAVTDGLRTLFGKEPRVLAETNMLTKNITFYDIASGSESDMVWTTIHEFGHVYDRNHLLSLRGEFKDKFWNNGEPLDKGISEYGDTSPREDFAETFAATVFLDNFKQPTSSMASYPPGTLPLPRGKSLSADRRTYIMDLLSK